MGNMGAVPPASQQPEVVEAELGVREYWFETFRRVVVIPDGEDCYVLSVDVYSRGEVAGDVLDTEEVGPVRVSYVGLDVGDLNLGGVSLEHAEAVILYAGNRVETVSVRLRFCGARSFPGYEDVWHLYRHLVRLVEGRDPALNPLKQPQVVEKVYAARGLIRRRRAPRPH
jgi:hypothetical protein